MHSRSTRVTSRTLRSISFTALAMVTVAKAPAQIYWTDSPSGLWSDTASWSTGVLPTSTDDVYLGYNYGSTTFTNPASLTLTVDTSASADNLFAFSILNIEDSLSLSGNLTTTSYVSLNAGSSLRFSNPATLTGNVLFSGNSFSEISGAFTLTNGSTIHGTYGEIQGLSFINQGTVSSDSGGTIEINSASLDNTAGTISASNNSLMYIGSNFTTSQLGTLRTADTSTITLGGSIDNTGSTLDVSGDGPAGSIILSGSLTNGLVKGELGFESGDVQNVEFQDNQTLNGSRLYVTDSVTFDSGLTINSGGSLLSNGAATLTGNVLFSGNSFSEISGAFTLTNGSTIHGTYGEIQGSSFINQGTVSSDSGGPLDINSNSALNQGELSAKNGSSLYVGSNLENAGRILVADPSSIEVGGTFLQDSSGILEFGLAGDTDFGTIQFDQSATLAGSLAVQLLNGYNPTIGKEWDVMNFSAGYSGSLFAPAGYELIYGANSIELEKTQSVPEPAPLVALLSGLAALALRRRRFPSPR